MQKAKFVKQELHIDKIKDHQGVHKTGDFGERFSKQAIQGGPRDD